LAKNIGDDAIALARKGVYSAAFTVGRNNFLSFATICRHSAGMRIFLFAFLSLCLLSGAVIAAPYDTPPSDAPARIVNADKTAPNDNIVVDPTLLSAPDHSDINRIEMYLNSLRSIQADFLQINDNGDMLRGKIAIQRPGKMRVTYDAPDKDFIVADGSMVHIWNDDLQQQTNIDQTSSLAEFILRDPVKLDGDVTVKKFERFPAKMEVTLVQTNDPAAGELTLVFEDNPLLLRQWKVLDPQGHTTGVNLENEERDVSFKSNTFNFTPPSFGKSPKSQIPN
jgi:outer membrane lipoprotein-sorting protein